MDSGLDFYTGAPPDLNWPSVLSLFICVLAQELRCSFSQICGEEPGSVLEKLLLSEQPERFRKAQAFIRAQGLSADSVAELVSSALVQALLASTQELQPGEIRASAGPMETSEMSSYVATQSLVLRRVTTMGLFISAEAFICYQFISNCNII